MRHVNSLPCDYCCLEMCCVRDRERQCLREMLVLHLAVNTATRWADEEAAIKYDYFRSATTRLWVSLQQKTIPFSCVYCGYFDNFAEEKVCVWMYFIRETVLDIVAFAVCVLKTLRPIFFPPLLGCVCLRACTCIDASVLERKCACCTWLFVCLAWLISLKWLLSIFIRLRKSDRVGVRKTERNSASY